jgi:PhnB protein
MAKMNPYLNFDGKAEEAFNFYKSVFGGEFTSIMKMSDVPPQPGMPPVPENEKNRVMHVALPIGENTVMASDIMPSMGHTLVEGNNFHVSVDTDSKQEVDKIFAALSKGGEVKMPVADMFWGSYFGMCKDKYGIQWMVGYTTPKS